MSRTYIPRPYILDASITSGTESAELDLDADTICGITTGSTVATAVSLTFKVATESGGTFNTLMDKDGTVYTVSITANDYIYLDPAIFAGVNFVKLVLNASDTVTLSVHTRRVM